MAYPPGGTFSRHVLVFPRILIERGERKKYSPSNSEPPVFRVIYSHFKTKTIQITNKLFCRQTFYKPQDVQLEMSH